MTHTEMIEAIKQYAEENDFQFYPDYSGRFMYGAKCIGVVHPEDINMPDDLLDWMFDTGYELEQEDYSEITEYCTKDDMGLDTITYWPNLVL